MPTRREGFATSAVDDKIYAIGGGNLGGMLAVVEAYDLATKYFGRKKSGYAYSKMGAINQCRQRDNLRRWGR